MRRTLLALALVALGAVSGCKHAAEWAVIDDEIATVGSMAKTPGDRSPDEVAAIEARLAALRARIEKVR